MTRAAFKSNQLYKATTRTDKDYLFYDEVFDGAINCGCGNNVNFEGFSYVIADGKLADLYDHRETPSELSSGALDYLLCNNCGVVGPALEEHEITVNAKVPAVIKYDISDPTLMKAIDLAAVG